MGAGEHVIRLSWGRELIFRDEKLFVRQEGKEEPFGDDHYYVSLYRKAREGIRREDDFEFDVDISDDLQSAADFLRELSHKRVISPAKALAIDVLQHQTAARALKAYKDNIEKDAAYVKSSKRSLWQEYVDSPPMNEFHNMVAEEWEEIDGHTIPLTPFNPEDSLGSFLALYNYVTTHESEAEGKVGVSKGEEALLCSTLKKSRDSGVLEAGYQIYSGGQIATAYSKKSATGTWMLHDFLGGHGVCQNFGSEPRNMPACRPAGEKIAELVPIYDDLTGEIPVGREMKVQAYTVAPKPVPWKDDGQHLQCLADLKAQRDSRTPAESLTDVRQNLGFVTLVEDRIARTIDQLHIPEAAAASAFFLFNMMMSLSNDDIGLETRQYYGHLMNEALKRFLKRFETEQAEVIAEMGKEPMRFGTADGQEIKAFFLSPKLKEYVEHADQESNWVGSMLGLYSVAAQEEMHVCFQAAALPSQISAIDESMETNWLSIRERLMRRDYLSSTKGSLARMMQSYLEYNMYDSEDRFWINFDPFSADGHFPLAGALGLPFAAELFSLVEAPPAAAAAGEGGVFSRMLTWGKNVVTRPLSTVGRLGPWFVVGATMENASASLVEGNINLPIPLHLPGVGGDLNGDLRLCVR